MGKFIDLTGQRFGRLTVINRAPNHISRCGQTKTMWNCCCDCGNTSIVSMQCLRSGRTLSCGCYLIDIITKHGGTSHQKNNDRLYKIWEDMKRRCNNSNDTSYHNYGARGIIVCPEWQHDYSEFRTWALQKGYDPNAKRGMCTLDRIDNNGNYCPDNCRWVTHKQQQNNTTRSRYIEYNGETHTCSEWSDITGLRQDLIYARYFKQHWDAEKTFTTPVYK